MTIQNNMGSVRIGGAQIASVKRGIGDGSRIFAWAKELSDLVTGGVLADFIDCETVSSPVNLTKSPLHP